MCLDTYVFYAFKRFWSSSLLLVRLQFWFNCFFDDFILTIFFWLMSRWFLYRLNCFCFFIRWELVHIVLSNGVEFLEVCCIAIFVRFLPYAFILGLHPAFRNFLNVFYSCYGIVCYFLYYVILRFFRCYCYSFDAWHYRFLSFCSCLMSFPPRHCWKTIYFFRLSDF